MALFDKNALERFHREERELRKRTILLVDDEVHNLNTLKYALSRRFEILTASDGAEALTLLKRDPNPRRIHMIISDQRMPNMTGVEFLAESIAIVPHAIRIILTGYTDVDAVMDSINKAHIYQFILKPFDEKDIILAVTRGLDLYDVEEKNRRLVEALDFFNAQVFSRVQGFAQAIGTATGMARAADESGPRDIALEETEQEAADLSAFLTRTATLSNVYTGHQRPNREQVDLLGLIHQAGETFLKAQPEGSVTIAYEWDVAAAPGEEDAEVLVDMDRDLFAQALEEVLANGATYAEPPATIVIEVIIHLQDNHVWVNVRDNGIGVDNEGGQELLKPFVRGARARDFSPDGLGVGLTQAKAIMDAHGGDLLITQGAEGSTVVLVVPLPADEEGVPVTLNAPTRKIAIFQDNAKELNLLREVLEFDGHEVLAYSDPEELAKSTRKTHPDLILMDGVWGRNTTEGIVRDLAKGVEGEVAPVVVLSREVPGGGERPHLLAGARTYVPKPINYSRLNALLRQIT